MRLCVCVCVYVCVCMYAGKIRDKTNLGVALSIEYNI